MNKLINVHWDLLGAHLANLSDEEQALFFKGFISELNNYDSHFLKERQMISIGEKLSPKIKTILQEYLPSLWYTGGEKII